MTTVLDVGDASGSAPEGPHRSRRRWLVLAAVAMVVLAAVVVVTRPRAQTPEQFLVFAQRLDPLAAPVGTWTRYDPSESGYATAPEHGWGESGPGTWTNTSDPASWVAVHGWQTTLPTASASTACSAAVDWLASTATTLELPASDSPPTTALCLAAVRTAVGAFGSSSDAWAGEGLQHADGVPRYRSGSIISTQESVQGRVTIAVIADATVFGR